MPIGSQIFSLLVLSFAVSSVAWTITQEELFREWREGCETKSRRGPNILYRKFFYLFTCEYCFSHWVALIVVGFTGFGLLFDDWRGRVIAFFVLPWIANQWMSLYRRLRVGIKYENALAENEVAEDTSESAKGGQ